MKKIIAILAVSTLGLSTPAHAQSLPAVGGLSTGATAGIIAAVVVIGVIIANNGSTSSTP